METLNSKLCFRDQQFHLGIDVHKRQWTVTIRSMNKEIKTFSMNPNPNELADYMKRHYPDGQYFSAYEAGFSGFYIHESLTFLGFNNQVIHPADIPTMDKEKRNKSDVRDSRKIARELEHGTIQGIYTPDRFHQEFRSLCRSRERGVSQQTRLKNRITSYLAFYGIPIPSHEELPHWSGRFIEWLKTQSLCYSSGQHAFNFMIDELLHQRSHLLKIIRQLRREVRTNSEIAQIITLLQTIPGVGFIAAITFYSEIIDIQRFTEFDQLKSFFGLAPSIQTTDETVIQNGLTTRHNQYLRYILIESAWVAIRHEPVLLHAYHQLLKRMKPQQAIIRIAVKLLRRIRFVWLNQKPYESSVK